MKLQFEFGVSKEFSDSLLPLIYIVVIDTFHK